MVRWHYHRSQKSYWICIRDGSFLGMGCCKGEHDSFGLGRSKILVKMLSILHVHEWFDSRFGRDQSH